MDVADLSTSLDLREALARAPRRTAARPAPEPPAIDVDFERLIGRRSWSGPDGRPAHHLLDPATGRPAYTGVVQVTAIAPTALEAEVRAKAAVLSGPDRAAQWLPHGGLVVRDDASYLVVA